MEKYDIEQICIHCRHYGDKICEIDGKEFHRCNADGIDLHLFGAIALVNWDGNCVDFEEMFEPSDEALEALEQQEEEAREWADTMSYLARTKHIGI